MNRPDAAQVAAVFGRAATTYDTVIPFFATFGRRLVELAAVAPGERVLDVAAGRGASLFPAAGRVGGDGSVLGIDLAAEMVDALAADIADREAANAAVRQMDAEHLTLPDGSVDVVLCGFALFLMPHPDDAAAGFFRVLRPGGRCAVSMPIGAGPCWDFFRPLVAQFAPRAARPLPPPPPDDVDLAAILRGAGFVDTVVIEEEVRFLLRDAEAWWEWAWSTGMRAVFESFEPQVLAELRDAAFAYLREHQTPEGLPLDQRARFVTARRPD